MINPNTLKQLNELCEIYKQRWSREVDYTVLPRSISQEKLLIILKRIVDTGESILVGYNKICLNNNKKDTFQ
ncbi:MAG: hypothetical protein NC429_00675 [Lachnospiraceae bacterium]|nr:hypothetical protein [Lachnospiraceae bacterium]